MEDIKVDFKLIIVAIYISIVMGTLVWIGYSIYSHFFPDKNENVENFVGDDSSTEIEQMGNKKNNLIDDNFFIEPDIKKKFQINNNNPIKEIKDWSTVTVGHGLAGYSSQYIIPASTINLRGDLIQSNILDMSSWTEDGTYEEFIEDFIQTVKLQDGLTEMKYTTRQLNIGGKEFTIVMREGENIIGSYLCLAKDGYACFLEIIVYKNFYDENLKDTIDKIFSTFTII